MLKSQASQDIDISGLHAKISVLFKCTFVCHETSWALKKQPLPVASKIWGNNTPVLVNFTSAENRLLILIFCPSLEKKNIITFRNSNWLIFRGTCSAQQPLCHPQVRLREHSQPCQVHPHNLRQHVPIPNQRKKGRGRENSPALHIRLCQWALETQTFGKKARSEHLMQRSRRKPTGQDCTHRTPSPSLTPSLVSKGTSLPTLCTGIYWAALWTDTSSHFTSLINSAGTSDLASISLEWDGSVVSPFMCSSQILHQRCSGFYTVRSNFVPEEWRLWLSQEESCQLSSV